MRSLPMPGSEAEGLANLRRTFRSPYSDNYAMWGAGSEFVLVRVYAVNELAFFTAVGVGLVTGFFKPGSLLLLYEYSRGNVKSFSQQFYLSYV